MEFAERLRQERQRAGLSQKELAEKANVTDRTIQKYESGKNIPTRLSSVKAVAEILGVTTEYLLGEEGLLIADAAERGGAKAKRDMQQLVLEVSGLFAGGDLTDEDRDAAMRALNEAYWNSKAINKKYTRKSYQKN